MKRRSGNEAFAHMSVPPPSNTSREGSGDNVINNNNNQQGRRVHFDSNKNNNNNNLKDELVLATSPQDENAFSVQAAGDPRLHSVISEFGNVRGLSKVMRTTTTTTSSSSSAQHHQNHNNNNNNAIPVAWCADTDGSITVRRGDDPTRVLIRIPKKDSGQFVTCIVQVGQHNVWAGYSDGSIRVYDVKTGLLLEELWHHEGAVCCLIVGSDNLVYSGAQDWKVYQWDPKSRNFLRLFFGHANSVRCMVTAQGNPWRSVFVSHQRRRTAEIALYQQQQQQQQASSEGKTSNDDNNNNNNQNDNDEPQPRSSSNSPSRSFPPEPITREGKVNTSAATNSFSISNNININNGLHLSLPKRAVLFSGSDDGTIRVWDALAPRQHTKDVACLHTFSGQHTKGVHTLLLHFDTMTLWSGGEDASVVVWDLESCNCLTNLTGVHNAPITAMASLENGTIWTGGKDGLVVIWNASKRFPLREFRHSRSSAGGASSFSGGGFISNNNSSHQHAYVSSITSMSRTETRKIWCSFSDGTLQVWTVDCPYGSGYQQDLIDSALDANVDSQFNTNAQNTPNRQRSPVSVHHNHSNTSGLGVDGSSVTNNNNNNNSLEETVDPTLARLEKKLKFSESVIRSCRSAMKATEEEREQERKRATEVEAKLYDALDRLEKLTMIRSNSSPSRSDSARLLALQQQQHQRGLSETSLGSPIQRVRDDDEQQHQNETAATADGGQEQDSASSPNQQQKELHHHDVSQINDLTAAVRLAQRQSEENDRLQNELINLNNELDKIKNDKGLQEIDTLKLENKKLQQQLSINQQHIESVEERNKELNQEVEDIRSQMQNQTQQMQQLQQQMQEQEDQLRSTSQLSQRPSAELTGGANSTRNSVSNAMPPSHQQNQQQQQQQQRSSSSLTATAAENAEEGNGVEESAADENNAKSSPLGDTTAEFGSGLQPPEAKNLKNVPREVLEERLRIAEDKVESSKRKEEEQEKELQEAQKLIELHAKEIEALEKETKDLKEENAANQQQQQASSSIAEKVASGAPTSVNERVQALESKNRSTEEENNNTLTITKSVQATQEVKEGGAQAVQETADGGAQATTSTTTSNTQVMNSDEESSSPPSSSSPNRNLSPRQEVDLKLENSKLQQQISEITEERDSLRHRVTEVISKSSEHCAELDSLRRVLAKFKEEQKERSQLFEMSNTRVQEAVEGMRQKLVEVEERRFIEEQRAFDAEASVEHELAKNSEIQSRLQSKELELNLALSSLRAFGKDLSDKNFAPDQQQNQNHSVVSSSAASSPITPFDSPDRSARGVEQQHQHHQGDTSSVNHSQHQHQQHQHSHHANHHHQNLLLPHISNDVPQHVLSTQIAQLKKSIHSITSANDSRQQLLNELNLRHSQDSRTISRLRDRNEKLVSLLQRNYLMMDENGEEAAMMNNNNLSEIAGEVEAQRIQQDEEEMENFAAKVEELESQKEKLQVALQHSIESQRNLSRELSGIKGAVAGKLSSSMSSTDKDNDNNKQQELLQMVNDLIGISDSKQKVIADQQDIISENSRFTQLLNSRGFSAEEQDSANQVLVSEQQQEAEEDQIIAQVEEALGGDADTEEQQQQQNTVEENRQEVANEETLSNNSSSARSPVVPREDYIQLRTVLDSLLVLVESAFKAEHDLRRIQQMTEENEIEEDNERNEEQLDKLIQQNENQERVQNEGKRQEEVFAAGSPPRIRSVSPNNSPKKTSSRNFNNKRTTQEEREREKKLLSLLKNNKIQLPPASEGTLTDRIKQASEALTLHLSHIAHIDETIIKLMRQLYEVSTTESITTDMLTLHVPKTVLKHRVQKDQEQSSTDKSLVVMLRKGALTSSSSLLENNNDNDEMTPADEDEVYKNTPTFAAHAWEHCLSEVVDRAVDRLRLQRLAFDGALRRTQSLKERVLLLSSESKNSTDILEQKAAALQEKQHDNIREWHEKRRPELVWSVWDSFSGVRTGLQRLSQHTAKLQAQLPREWRGLHMASDVNEIISAFSLSFNRSQFILAECLTDEEKEEIEKNGRTRATNLLSSNHHQQSGTSGEVANGSRSPIDYFSPKSNPASIQRQQQQQQAQRTPRQLAQGVVVSPTQQHQQQQQEEAEPSQSPSITLPRNLSNAFVRSTPPAGNTHNSSSNNRNDLDSTISPRGGAPPVASGR